jgi:hypothetical protein
MVTSVWQISPSIFWNTKTATRCRKKTRPMIPTETPHPVSDSLPRETQHNRLGQIQRAMRQIDVAH